MCSMYFDCAIVHHVCAMCSVYLLDCVIHVCQVNETEIPDLVPWYSDQSDGSDESDEEEEHSNDADDSDCCW